MNKLTETQMQVHLGTMPGWSLDDEGAIVKKFAFSDFANAILFVNRLADAAEEAQHHPDIDIRFNNVTVSLSTHDAGGLTALDFEMAEKAESAASIVRAVA